MPKREARRTTAELSAEEQQRMDQQRAQVAAELPELAARDQMRREAREEATLSGQLRRTIHASELTLSQITAQAGITPLMLDDFLTGERTLRSDVMDRLADVLGCELSHVK